MPWHDDSTRSPMRPVTRARPCFACGKPDWCFIADDSSAVHCRRHAEGATKALTDKGGSPYWLHHRDSLPAVSGQSWTFRSHPKATSNAPARDWQAEAERYAAALTPELAIELATALRLPVDALDALPLLGWTAASGGAWTFPERDGAGRVVGIATRSRDGRKRAIPGSARGLTLPDGFGDRGGPLLLVEGPTDALAASYAGLATVGRPGNSAGHADLATLLADWPRERPLIVAGERDAKPDGRWPGRDGAERCARALATALGRPVAWAMPPGGMKDIRDWLTAQESDWGERGSCLAEHLSNNATEIEPNHAPEIAMNAHHDPATPPWPQPMPLSEEPAAQPFPLDVLPAALQSIAGEIAEAMNCPPDFPALFMLAMIGGAVGNSLRVGVKPSYCESACLFAVAVGAPGSAKSPPFQLLRQPFDAVEARRLSEHQRAIAAWKSAPEEERGERPVMRRCIVSNTTTESLTVVLSENPRGVLYVRDELSGLIAGLNQYKGGCGDDKSFWLSAWSHAPILNDRKSDRDTGGAPRSVPAPFVAVVGTTQPDVLESMRRAGGRGPQAVDDGFTDRFLFAVPAARPAIGENWKAVDGTSFAAWCELIGRLLAQPMEETETGPRPRDLPLSESGCGAWQAFTDAHAAETNAADFPPSLAGPWQKLRACCARLALILAAARWGLGVGGEPLESIAGGDVAAAARVVDYFKTQVCRARHLMDDEPGVVDARRLLRWIEARGPGERRFTRREAFEGTKSLSKKPVGGYGLRHEPQALPVRPD